MTVWVNTLVARLLSLLFLLNPGVGMFRAPAPAAPPEPNITGSAAQEVKIMSFNLWMGGTGERKPENRLPYVVQTIRAERPDSFGIQEGTQFWRESLAEELGDLYGVAGNIGRDWGEGEGSPVFYLKEKYNLVTQGVFWLNTHPLWPGPAWGTLFNRMAAWVLLEDLSTGFVYLHINAHMDHISPLARTNGAALITEFIQTMNQPTVLTGDMNCKPSARAIQYFVQGGLTDTRTAAKTAQGACTFHNNKKNVDITAGDPIDYIFANGYLKSVKSYRAIHTQYGGIYPSDHFPIVSVLTLQN